MKRASLSSFFSRRSLLLFAIAVLAVYVVAPQLGNFDDSLTIARTADRTDMLWALAATAGGYLAAAASYYALAFRPLRYGRTLFVQLAGMFANRLIPAGIGGMGVNYQYLRRERHEPTKAIAVVATNNMLGLIGNMALVVFCAVTAGLGLPATQSVHLSSWFAAGTGVVAVTLAVAGYVFRRQAAHTTKAILQNIRQYRHRPSGVVVALLAAVSLAIYNTLALWLCSEAVAPFSITFGMALVILNLGVALGAMIPTPGGVGGVEAGLVAGLVAYGLPAATALAIALLYRLISFWLPLLVGGFAFMAATRRHYI